jgi:hypothetical protein
MLLFYHVGTGEADFLAASRVIMGGHAVVPDPTP